MVPKHKTHLRLSIFLWEILKFSLFWRFDQSSQLEPSACAIVHCTWVFIHVVACGILTFESTKATKEIERFFRISQAEKWPEHKKNDSILPYLAWHKCFVKRYWLRACAAWCNHCAQGGPTPPFKYECTHKKHNTPITSTQSKQACAVFKYHTFIHTSYITTSCFIIIKYNTSNNTK